MEVRLKGDKGDQGRKGLVMVRTNRERGEGARGEEVGRRQRLDGKELEEDGSCTVRVPSLTKELMEDVGARKQTCVRRPSTWG